MHQGRRLICLGHFSDHQAIRINDYDYAYAYACAFDK